MDPTRVTLLLRLRDRSDQTAWRTFDSLYRGMIVGFARWRGLSEADADDVAQQCVAAVVEGIGQYQHLGSFKTWLRAIAEKKIVDVFRKRGREAQAPSGVLAAEADPGTSLDEQWERNWARAHFSYCLEAVRAQVEERTYEAFTAYAIHGRPAEEVAAAVGISVGQVYVAKHRVLERVRAMLAELTGSDLTGDDL